MAKTTSRVTVAIGEGLAPVGELVFESDGRRQTSMFRYSDAWLDEPMGFALSPAMPLSTAPFFTSATADNSRAALPLPVGDGTPDSWGRALLQRGERRPSAEFDYLVGVDDLTRQGALRYLDAQGRPLAHSWPPVPRIADLADLRRLASTPIENLDPAARSRLIGSGASVGGARPKACVVDADGALAIAKFTTDQDTLPIERVEVATLLLANDVGITAASARLELGGTSRPVAVIKRFDRRGGVRSQPSDRVPYLSAQSFIGAELATGGFYTDIADALRTHGARPTAQLAELFRRILFSILVSNNDDHLRNHGLLHVGGGLWALSPAFDINPQPERTWHLETGISELSGHAASIEAALEAAPFFDVDHDEARSMLGSMVAVIDGRWRHRCREAGLSAAEIAHYAPAFEHEETRVAERLAART